MSEGQPGVWVRKDVRWTVTPKDDGRWELRVSWRYITPWDAPDAEWHRKPERDFATLNGAMIAVADEYREGARQPLSLQIKLGPPGIGGEAALFLEQNPERREDDETSQALGFPRSWPARLGHPGVCSPFLVDVTCPMCCLNIKKALEESKSARCPETNRGCQCRLPRFHPGHEWGVTGPEDFNPTSNKWMPR